MKRRGGFFLFLFLLAPGVVLSQEILQNLRGNYQQFLELIGRSSGPLNYRTIAEVEGETGSGSDQGPWATLAGPTVEYSGLRLTWLPVQGFTSYNVTSPFGQNDGALWQGKGLNAAFSGGFRIASSLGVEATVSPGFSYSQNQAFEILPSAYSSPFGYIWSLGKNKGIDAPQRFGPDPLLNWDWGDTEIRFSWSALTVGFGTQLPWIGPSKVNSIFHSNNSKPYPKIDVGVRRVDFRWGDLDVGSLEARVWAGYLSESQFFDSNPNNDHNLIDALTLAYRVPYTGGLTLFFNKSYLSKWTADSWATLPALFNFKGLGAGAEDIWDQRVVLGFDYLIPEAMVEVYGEMGYNDYPGPNLDAILREFQHTTVYTGGVRKAVELVPNSLWGELAFEWSSLEMAVEYSQFLWATNFYMHHQITQGYTNEGQWLGTGIGAGGNSQYLGYRLWGKEGVLGAFAYRYNPDNDFINRLTTPGSPGSSVYNNEDYKAVLAVGVEGSWNLSPSLQWGAGLTGILVLNPTYEGTWLKSSQEAGPRFVSTFRWVP